MKKKNLYKADVHNVKQFFVKNVFKQNFSQVPL